MIAMTTMIVTWKITVNSFFNCILHTKLMEVMFDEIPLLPKHDQMLFQYLTYVAFEDRTDLRGKTLRELCFDVRHHGCASCEYLYRGKSLRDMSPDQLLERLKVVKKRLSNIPDNLFHLLVQSAGQPHHPTRKREKKHWLFPIFEECLRMLGQGTEVVVAELRDYRSTPDDSLLAEVCALLTATLSEKTLSII